MLSQFELPARPGLLLEDAVIDGRYLGTLESKGYLLLQFAVQGSPEPAQLVILPEGTGQACSYRFGLVEQARAGIPWTTPAPQ